MRPSLRGLRGFFSVVAFDNGSVSPLARIVKRPAAEKHFRFSIARERFRLSYLAAIVNSQNPLFA